MRKKKNLQPSPTSHPKQRKPQKRVMWPESQQSMPFANRKCAILSHRCFSEGNSVTQPPQSLAALHSFKEVWLKANVAASCWGFHSEVHTVRDQSPHPVCGQGSLHNILLFTVNAKLDTAHWDVNCSSFILFQPQGTTYIFGKYSSDILVAAEYHF